MNTYEFNINLYGFASLEVVAESREDAERLVKETMESITIKDLELKETKNKDITITESEVKTSFRESKDKDYERWTTLKYQEKL